MSEFVLTETEYGKVRGIKKLSVLNGKYLSFTGIPYAKPPIGNLRFKVRISLHGFLSRLKEFY